MSADFSRREMIGVLALPLSAGGSVLGFRAVGPGHGPAARQATAPAGREIVRTLTRDIPVSSLPQGPILFHEHLSFHPQGTTQHFTDDVDLMVEEAKGARRDGIACIVDAAHSDNHRSLAALKRITTEAELAIVASGGYYLQRSYPPDIAAKSADQIADELVSEASTFRLGAYGEIGQQFGELTPDERKVFQAVGKAHVRNGLPVFTHSPYNKRATAPVPTEAALRQLDVLESVGVNPRRVAIGHVCCLDDPKAAVARRLAERGAFVGFDRVTLEAFMPDADRVTMAMALIDAGYADQLLLSSDFSNVKAVKRNGGPGLAQTVTVFAPMLQKAGVSEQTLHRILVDNPRRWLGFVPTT